ncbi:Uncharacterised protein [Enterobacter hormaechei]|nr:Uncharacterised protein [Enterobacter hormaechei]
MTVSLFHDVGDEIPGIATDHGDFVDIGITAVLHFAADAVVFIRHRHPFTAQGVTE